MSRPVADSVFETTNSTGTGPITLAGASTGYRGFREGFADGAIVAYVIQQATYANDVLTALGREIGLGTLTYGAHDTISRDVVLTQHGGISSGGKLDLAAGGADVFVAAPAALHAIGARPISVSTALTAADMGLTILGTAGAGGITVTLPDGDHLPPGSEMRVAKVDAAAGAVNVEGHGGDLVAGTARLQVTARWEMLACVWSGSDWLVSAQLGRATSAEINAGTDELKYVSPKALKDAGVMAIGKAGSTDVRTGTDDEEYVTPAGLRGSEIAAAAWANIDGTGSVTVDDSFNVASVTDISVGAYGLSWDADFATTNYAVACSGVATVNDFRNVSIRTTGLSVGSADIITGVSRGTALSDADPICVIVFGEWA